MFPSLFCFNLKYQYLRLIVNLLLFAAPQHIHSWDLAVASDAGLNLLTLDGSLEMTPAVSLWEDIPADMYALAYDPTSFRFFFSVDEHLANHSIYQFHLSTNSVTPLIPKGPFEVQGLAYDTALRTLYWTDGNGHTIRRMLLDTPDAQPQNVSVLPTQVPMGIAVSYCHRAIFWANNNHTSASLDRAELDGSKHLQIVTKDIFQPLGVTIDEAYGKVYWTDDRPGIYYRIERCGLDGSDRELIMRRTNQEPFGIALTASTILWSDASGRNVWSLSVDMTFPNHTSARLEPGLLYKFTQQKPYGVAVNRNVTMSCEPVKELRKVSEPAAAKDVAETASSQMPADFFDSPCLHELPAVCLNGGETVGVGCHCKLGFSGKRCEIPICYQHCLHGGVCYVDRRGYPDCQCRPGYEGRRCERDVCDEFCLAGGRCYVESGQPSCHCAPGTSGQRCEVTASVLGAPQQHDVPILAGLAAVACTSLVVVAVLSWRVCVLRRRPRVKKRYIVNKRFRTASGPTPLTSRPPPSPAAVEQCEITIENCCNMNICETPCFEPNLRTVKSSSSKADDRRNLLSNMEEPGGSD